MFYGIISGMASPTKISICFLSSLDEGYLVGDKIKGSARSISSIQISGDNF